MRTASHPGTKQYQTTYLESSAFNSRHDGSEKPNRQLGFELQSSLVIENRNKYDISSN